MDTIAPLGDLLVRHRIAAGLGHAELARRSGLSERTLRDLERGATGRPRRQSVRALAMALDLTGPELSAFLGSGGPAASIAGGTASGRGSVAKAGAGSGKAVSAGAVSIGGVAGAVAWARELFGRVSELRALAELVTAGPSRLISVTGPGGVGKSRLVAALVTELAQRSWDIRTVDVSGLDDPALVLEAVADAFGVGGGARLGPVERLAARLREARAVIVVDGMEHLVAAGPGLSTVVRRCPGLTVVVTSRRPLRVTGENQLRLEGLPMPAALALFAARASAVVAGFEIDDGNRDEIVAICGRVECLPLAIEVAAQSHGRPQAWRTAVESGLDAVSASAGALFDVLGAFSGGAGLDDVEGVAARLGNEPGATLEALAELVDMSLVRVDVVGGDTRYTVREVARLRLGVGAQRDRVRHEVAAHFLGRVGQGAIAAGNAANVRAAVAWATVNELELIDEPVVHGLFRHYEVSGRLAEGQAALDRIGAAGRPKAWVHAGHLARLRGDFTSARRYGQLALQHLSPGDHDGRCRTHLMLGSVATDLREPARSRKELHAALVQARRAGDLRLAGRVLNNLGTLSMETGRLGDAERLLLAALEAKRRGDASDIDCGRTLFNLAETAVDDGRFEVGLLYAGKAVRRLVAGGHHRLAALAATTAALAHLHRGEAGAALAASGKAIVLLGEGGQDDRRTRAVVNLRRSVAAHAAGDFAQATGLVRQAIPVALENPKRDQEEIAYALEMHADLMCGRDAMSAARLLGTAGQLRHGSTRPITPAWERVSRRAADACRERLGARGFDSHRGHGFVLDEQGLREICAAIG